MLRWLTRPLAEMEARRSRRRAAARGAARCRATRVTVVDVGVRGRERRAAGGAAAEPGARGRAPDALAPSDIAARFRAARPPVLGRIHDGRFLLDLRGIFDARRAARRPRPVRPSCRSIIGTAGHIDHGKTVARPRAHRAGHRSAEGGEGARHLDRPGLRLPRRARTASAPASSTCPGHERFIRNMLAGAHGIDLVLFTVAADDGVMPQTEEHLDILHLLGVRARHLRHHQDRPGGRGARRRGARGDRDPRARHDARGRAGDRRSRPSPARAWTRCGRRSRRQLAPPGAPPTPDGYFRLPVDRAFVMRGHGVVVTGTAIAGTVATGDTLRVLPGGETRSRAWPRGARRAGRRAPAAASASR